jgi:SEC-C motif-containing protein
VGEVEFEATHDGGVLHERSRFVRRAGRWVYVDGDLI